MTPLGQSAEASWRGYVAGRSGISRVESFDAEGDKVAVAGEVKAAAADELASRLSPDVRDRTGRFTHFALAAAREALGQAGNPHRESPERYGVICGVGFGSPLPSTGYRVGPTTIIKVMPNAAPAWIAILERLKGPNLACSSACASGAHGLGLAYDQVALGRATGMLAGGVDTVVTRDVMRTYAWMRALNTARGEEPAKMSRPFDATRRGFVLSEGAGFLMLEEWEHATRRGARVLAEVKGWAANSDAHHIVAVAPEGEGMARAMGDALEGAGMAPEQVDYISAHGTSTKMNDREETRAIRTIFGRHADRLMVSSQKSMTGHAQGGAGAVEAVVTVLSIVNQTATPTINLDHPDPDCDLDYVPHVARQQPIRVALNNSFGFGGHNTTMVFAHPEGT